MKRSLHLLLVLVLIIASCKDANENGPAPLDKDNMTALMTDLHMAEIYSTLVKNDGHVTNKNMDSLAVYYKSIIEHHGLTVDEFKDIMLWYSKNNRDFDSVYNSVLSDLSMYEGLQSAENKIED